MANSRVIVIDYGLTRITKAVMGASSQQVAVGVLPSASEEVKTAAIVNEFGTSGPPPIPSRPFMRRAVDSSRSDIDSRLNELASDLSVGKDNTRSGLMRLGVWLAGRMKRSIQSAPGWATPNAPATVKKKGQDKPLYEHGDLLSSINVEPR